MSRVNGDVVRGRKRLDQMTAQSRARLIGGLLLAAALVVTASTPARADHTPEHALQQINALERAIQNSRQATERYRQASQQYQSAAAAAEQRIAEYAAQERTAQNEADGLAAEIAIADEQFVLTAFQMEQTQSDIASLDSAIAAAASALAERERLYAAHLRAIYRQALVSPLEMLLSSRSLTDFATRIQQLAFVSVQDRRLVSELRQQRSAAQDLRAASELKRTELEALSVQVEEQRRALAEERDRYEELAAGVASARANSEAERASASANGAAAARAAERAAREGADFERQRNEAQLQYERLAAGLQGGGKPWSGGTLDTWPMSGTITSFFGMRWGTLHTGLDIAAPFYRPIVAAAAGTVQVVGKPYLAYGDSATVVIIQHAGNFSTLYGHLDDRAWPPIVRPGQYVQAGQVIGYNGSTGFSTGPHVHFMTIVDGKAVDPLRYLPPR